MAIWYNVAMVTVLFQYYGTAQRSQISKMATGRLEQRLALPTVIPEWVMRGCKRCIDIPFAD